jgi:hypothetical protein
MSHPRDTPPVGVMTALAMLDHRPIQSAPYEQPPPQRRPGPLTTFVGIVMVVVGAVTALAMLALAISYLV